MIDFAGLARLYGYRYCAVDSEASLARALAPSGADAAPRNLLDLRLDPALNPVMAARHFCSRRERLDGDRPQRFEIARRRP